MDLRSCKEWEFRRRVCETLWDELDPEPEFKLDRARRVDEVRIGNFVLDMLAPNAKGGLTIVEFKVVMSKDTLAQLLLYPRALRSTLRPTNVPVPDIRMLLVTPYLDWGVVEVIKELNPKPSVFFRLCVKNEDRLALVEPRSSDEWRGQCYDQVSESASRIALTWNGSELRAKGSLIWPLASSISKS